jgi:hypothetical protein
MDVTCFPLRLAVHLCGGGSEGRESGLRAEEREATNERIMVGEREARANCLSRVVLARCGRWGVGCRWCCPYFSCCYGSVEAKANVGINFGHVVRLGHT